MRKGGWSVSFYSQSCSTAESSNLPNQYLDSREAMLTSWQQLCCPCWLWGLRMMSYSYPTLHIPLLHRVDSCGEQWVVQIALPSHMRTDLAALLQSACQPLNLISYNVFSHSVWLFETYFELFWANMKKYCRIWVLLMDQLWQLQ